MTNKPTKTVEVEVAPPATPEKPKAKEIISFTVKRIKSGNFVIESKPPSSLVPSANEIVACLPPKNRKYVRAFFVGHDYYGIYDLMAKFWPTVSCESWAEAITKAHVLAEKSSTEGTFSATAAIKSAYIALDDTLYALKPVAIVGTNKALATMRKKAQAEIKEFAEKLRTEAKTKADKIVANAHSDAESIYIAANTKLDEANRKLREAHAAPPKWACDSGFPLLFTELGWRIVLPCSMKIKKFVYEYKDSTRQITRVWAAQDASPVLFRYSAALGDQFSVTGMRNLDFNHPHMTALKSCMQPADAPTRLNSLDDVRQLKGSVERTLTAIDLHSMLLEGRTPYWGDFIWRFVPKDLKELINAHLPNGSNAVQQALLAAARAAAAAQAQPNLVPPSVPAVVEIEPRDADSRETWTTS